MSENTSVAELQQKVASLELEMAAYRQGVKSLLKGGGFESTARSIFGICKKLVGATVGHVTLLEEDGHENRVLFLGSGDAACTAAPHMHANLRGLRAEAYRKAKVVYCNNFAESASGRILPDGHIALKNVMFAPLIVDGKVLGLIGLANKETDFSEKDACRAEVFGEFAAMALRNARLDEKRKNNERTLMESEEKFRMMFRTSPDSISLNRLSDGVYIDVNEGFVKLTGYRREEVVGRTTLEMSIFLDQHERERMRFELERMGHLENMEIRFRMKNGKTRIGLLSAQILRLNHEDVILSVARDITERKEAEQKLQESEAKYRQLVDLAPAGIYEIDLDALKFISVNEVICEYSGYTEAELFSMSLFDLIAEESKPLLIDQVLKFQAGELPSGNAEYKVRTKQGDYLWTLANIKTFEARQGVNRATVVIQDITERKRMEEELRFTANNLALATDAAEMGFWHWEIQKDILVWDNKMYALYGVRPEDFSSAKEMWKRIIHQKDLPDVFSAIDNSLKTREKLHVQFRALCPSGSIRILECHASILSDAEGNPLHMIGVTRDITERKKREKNLRLQKELLQSILDNIPLMVVFFNPECGIRWVNRTWELKLGWSYAESCEFSLTHMMDRFYPDREERERAIDCIFRADGEWREFKTSAKNGGEINARWTNVRLSDGTIIGIGEDVSDRKKEEQERQELKGQLLQAQKMEAIGTLAGGIAHDFNNLLFPILGYAEMLKDDLPASDPTHKSVDQILTATKRATDLVRQILTFSRQTDQEIRPLKLQPILKEALKLSRSTLPTTIEIVQEIDADCGYVLADSSQIHQLVMNLVTNAYHAMENSGGILTVSLHSAFCDRVARKDKFLGEPCIRLMIRDTGTGMDAAVKARIFEPYFTTKAIEKGTGLGLPVVHGIVNNLNGEIFVDSEPGKGTTFEIYLPQYASVQESGTADSTSSCASLPRGNERILLVDDEPPILEMEKKMLEKLGYRVETCLSSDEALETFRADPYAYEMLITDMTMPHLTGDRLAKACLEIRADFPIVLCTGFSEKMGNAEAADLGIKGFLFKPFVQSELAYSIRKAFDAKANVRET